MHNQSLANLLEQYQVSGQYRQRNKPISPETSSDKQLNFSSNDYLSLSNDERLRRAYQEGFARYPIGSGGSMVISGYHQSHEALIKYFTKQLACEDGLLFSSGYAANLAIMALMAKLNCHLLLDKQVHASFYDGAHLSKTHFTRFFHNNVDDFVKKLSIISTPTALITEGIFSMSGQIAPLAAFRHHCKREAIPIIVDEAHSFGLLGPKGLGAVPAQGLNIQDVPLRIIPFGKAFCAQGAIVVGQVNWIDALLQSARSFIYSTGISPALAHGLLSTLHLLTELDERREKLSALIQYFKRQAKQSALNFTYSETPIQQLQLGSSELALYFSKQLVEKNIFCQAIRPPTVSKQAAGLRIILNYQHNEEDIDKLFAVLNPLSFAIQP